MISIVGCTSKEPPQFRLNLQGREPRQAGPVQRETMAGLLEKLFGTPDQPIVPPDSNLQLELLKTAAGPIGSDQTGNAWGLFRQHCVTCHGIGGDGAGPTAALLNPYPRDFRNGIFKYTSTAGGAKPVLEDLKRTLRRGIPGTSMPSFAALSAEQMEALVEYVKYLAIRGETELYVLQLVIDEDEYSPYLFDVVEDGLAPVIDMWSAARDMAIDRASAEQAAPPTDTPGLLAASIARGHKLYSSENARCVECHGPEGAGDGEQAELFDDWNKDKKGSTPKRTKQLAKLYALPMQELRPRNFTEGKFLGGARPIDLYWRIHVGIKGTPMPAAGPTPQSSGVLSPTEIWDVVNYVRSRAGRLKDATSHE